MARSTPLTWIVSNAAAIPPLPPLTERTHSLTDGGLWSMDDGALPIDGTELPIDSGALPIAGRMLSINKRVLPTDNGALSADRTVLSIDKSVLSIDEGVLSIDEGVLSCGSGKRFSTSRKNLFQQRFGERHFFGGQRFWGRPGKCGNRLCLQGVWQFCP